MMPIRYQQGSKTSPLTSFLFPPNSTATSEATLTEMYLHNVIHRANDASVFNHGFCNFLVSIPSNQYCDSKAKEAGPCIRNPRSWVKICDGDR